MNKTDFFKKYNNEELLKDLESFRNGKGRLNKVLNHFFEEEMYKCKGGRGSLSPMQAIEDIDIVNKIVEYTRSKPKFYLGNDIANVKSFFRNAGRIAQKVANFPVREADTLYQNYSSQGDNIYDFSCGFGSRMSACLLSGRNYYGTDPNTTLCNKLNEYGEFLEQDNLIGVQRYKIFCQGSEDYIEELEGKIDMAFSSPPYFDLEKYNEEESQSIVKFKQYDNWINGYVKPTIINCSKYLKSGGLMLVNIKNMTSGKKYKLFDDWFNILNELETMEYVETINMNQLSKRDYKGKHFTGVTGEMGFKEPVMVFKKK
jgi:DNA modification methylase